MMTIFGKGKMQQITEKAEGKSTELHNSEGTISKESICQLFGVESLTEVDFIKHPAHSPVENMLFDIARAEALLERKAAPMLRLYSWNPYAVSLGAHQRERDIDVERCRERGLEIVRRPTGGRAVFHAEELTYSLAVPLQTETAPQRTIHDIYRDVHIVLLNALQNLGFQGISFQKSQTNFRALYRSSQVSMPCFASSARYELMYEGRKVVGSAQKLYSKDGQNVVLQHGSILLGKAHECLADVLNLGNDTEREEVRRVIRTQSVSLQEVWVEEGNAAQEISWERCADAVFEAFGNVPKVKVE